jgi:tRNA nucleotidyltransferase (CCA-adding enzyme)
VIKLPKDVEYIINELKRAGYEGFAAGGCVRDSLLGKPPTDWDITTNAAPEDVMRVFKNRRILPTGIKHGTVTLFLKNIPYEITAYRLDGMYSDGRRPDNVTFTNDLTEDLSRRDFTINAMAYGPSRGLVDLFGGREDLKNRIIRCVGSAKARFSEDYLRIMRAYRFSATLDFDLDIELKEASIALRENITPKISAERIRVELDKLLISGRFNRIAAFMEDLGSVILPEVTALRNVPQRNAYHYLDVYGHTMEALRHAGPELCLKLCALLHDTGKALAMTVDSGGITHFKGHAAISENIARDVLKRLKYDNETIDTVTTLTREHSFKPGMSRGAAKRLLSRLGINYSRLLLDFCRADTMAKNSLAQEHRLPAIQADKELLEDILQSGEPYTLKGLSVGGGDIMAALGVAAGKNVGEALNYLLERVMDDPGLNKRETLLELLRDKVIN